VSVLTVFKFRYSGFHRFGDFFGGEIQSSQICFSNVHSNLSYVAYQRTGGC